jgi:hypothetical protein
LLAKHGFGPNYLEDMGCWADGVTQSARWSDASDNSIYQLLAESYLVGHAEDKVITSLMIPLRRPTAR